MNSGLRPIAHLQFCAGGVEHDSLHLKMTAIPNTFDVLKPHASNRIEARIAQGGMKPFRRIRQTRVPLCRQCRKTARGA